MTTETARPIKLFFSYSHKDEDLKNDLVDHLSILKHQGFLAPWQDRDIEAGTEWEQEISDALNSADVILLLVSSSFVASKYCYSIEMTRAMERHEKREARVIPIILKPCDWTHAPFAKLQALPRDAKAITTWSNRDEAFTGVAKSIRATIEKLRKGP